MEFNRMMMKKFLLIMMMSISGSLVKAQTFNEWFKQKKTQIQYLVDQIGALRVYSQSLQKGYEITNSGLEFIHGVKKGDFDLHQLYFTSLKKVNPQVKSYSKIEDIILLQKEILNSCNRQKRRIMQSQEISNGEMNYLVKVFNNLLEECGQIIDQLVAVLDDDYFEMRDDERIKIIDQLYDQMQDRYVFIQHFGNETIALGIQRMKDQNDVKTLREGFGIY